MPHMALDLSQLIRQIDALCENASKRQADQAARLPLAKATLAAIAADPEATRQRAADVAHRFRWAGAIPTDEPINAVYPLPAHPARASIVAADGSQIHPDRHGLALYYLINIGSIVFRHGADEAPACSLSAEVFFEDEDLYENESLISGEKINAERDARELGELARLGASESGAAPTVTLLDNGLLLFFSLQEQDRKAKDKAVANYLARMDQLKASGAALAGVVDRPRAANIIRLLHLATLDEREVDQDHLRGTGRFQHMVDTALFGALQPGERSALFVNAAPDNLEYYKPRGHTVCFFYLNAGRPGKDSLLRIEVPEWVAQDRARLDLVHAAIVEQCRFTDGFPYVLMRAHELAVVTMDERRAFDELVMGALVWRGFTPGVSQKQQGKEWTGSGKRRFP